MLVVRAPMWMPSVTNGSWLISTGTRGRPIAPGDGQVGALPEQARVEQGDDLAVDRRDAQRRDRGDDVTAHRAAQPDRPEDGGRRGVGDVQCRRQDLAVGPPV